MNDTATRTGPTHTQWMEIAAEEYRRLDVVLRSLTAEDWQAQTDCGEWDVRDMVAHLVGAAEASSRMREVLRQKRAAKQHAGEWEVDRINAVQLAERADRSPTQLIDDLVDAGYRAVRGRRRTPWLIRIVPIPTGKPLGVVKVGFVLDVIYTRDAWMHRMDILRATGKQIDLDDYHDGAVINHAAIEWSSKHPEASLRLTGIAGGTYGHGASAHEADPLTFVRALSGREELPWVTPHEVVW